MGENCLESYQAFAARMVADGWSCKRFRTSTPEGFAKALKNWNNGLHLLSKEFHPEHINEVWYKLKDKEPELYSIESFRADGEPDRQTHPSLILPCLANMEELE